MGLYLAGKQKSPDGEYIVTAFATAIAFLLVLLLLAYFASIVIKLTEYCLESIYQKVKDFGRRHADGYETV